MNSAKAIYYNSIAPENISQLILNIIKGFEDTKLRSLNYFDLFIIISFYSYRPAQEQFQSIKFTPINIFQRDIERNPDIFSNFIFQYEKSINHIKLGTMYALNKEYIVMDENMNITINKKFKSDNNIIFNMGKVFSTKSTASLYNFFKADINVI